MPSLEWSWLPEGWLEIKVPTYIKQAFSNERQRRSKSMNQGRTLIKDDTSVQVAGDIGQALFMAWLEDMRIPYETTEPKAKYDVVVGGLKIDVKIANRKEKPLPHYNCNVSQSQLEYPTDAYVFGSAVGDTIYFTGFSMKEDFLSLMRIEFPDDKWAAIRMSKYGPPPAVIAIEETYSMKDFLKEIL